MNSRNEKLNKIVRLMLEKRWLWVAFTSIVVIAVEYEEHRAQPEGAFSVDFWRETLLFGLLLPVSYGILVSLMVRLYEAKDEADRTINQQQNLSLQLRRSNDWNSVLSTIVKFPASILPVAATSLRVINPDKNSFELAEYWSVDERISGQLANDIHRDVCRNCLTEPSKASQFLLPCSPMSDGNPGQFSSFCLPLMHHDETVALLHLHFAGQPTLSARSVRALNMSAQEMALALETARLEQQALEQIQATDTERRRIARDLHDTLGQNISYLRLKLDQLTGEDALRGIGMIRMELERMRDIADDAYLQVRNTLADLRPETAADLNSVLRDHLRLVGSRANFKAHFMTSGTPRVLEAHMRNQLMYIFREILNNIEKHAGARNVFVNLDWGASEFCFIVRDDGLGFDAEGLPPEGHFGLKIMQERASDLKATLTFSSQPKLGTQVMLRLPMIERPTIVQIQDGQCDQSGSYEVIANN